jgi:hypothetical protein
MPGQPPGRFAKARRAECRGPYPIRPYRHPTANGNGFMPPAIEKT